MKKDDIMVDNEVYASGSKPIKYDFCPGDRVCYYLNFGKQIDPPIIGTIIQKEDLNDDNNHFFVIEWADSKRSSELGYCLKKVLAPNDVLKSML